MPVGRVRSLRSLVGVCVPIHGCHIGSLSLRFHVTRLVKRPQRRRLCGGSAITFEALWLPRSLVSLSLRSFSSLDYALRGSGFMRLCLGQNRAVVQGFEGIGV